MEGGAALGLTLPSISEDDEIEEEEEDDGGSEGDVKTPLSRGSGGSGGSGGGAGAAAAAAVGGSGSQDGASETPPSRRPSNASMRETSSSRCGDADR